MLKLEDVTEEQIIDYLAHKLERIYGDRDMKSIVTELKTFERYKLMGMVGSKQEMIKYVEMEGEKCEK